MSILAKAKELAETSRSNHQKELEADAKQRVYKDGLLVATRVAVQTLLASQLNGEDGFESEFKTGSNGLLACLKRNGNAIGFVCVEGKHFTFDGSDECRDIPAWGIKIEFRSIPQSDRAIASNGSYIGHNQDMDAGVKAFADSLADHLKGFF